MRPVSTSRRASPFLTTRFRSNHVSVTPQTWTPLGLPHPDEVPNLSLQVVNFHRPLLGTFHQKAMVVDRKIALLNSNNIQDRPNLEVRLSMKRLEARD